LARRDLRLWVGVAVFVAVVVGLTLIAVSRIGDVTTLAERLTLQNGDASVQFVFVRPDSDV
jgi:hypothetical protein